jgi:cytochrome c biogenesis protein CcmG/thiol:disulfide interchange protein DsbE
MMGVGILASVLGWNLTHQTPPPKVGAPAPVFSLHRLAGGGDLSLASLRGKTVVLNFFASWCAPCKREAPVLQQLWKRDRGENLVVLGVDTGPDEAGDGRRFVQAHGLTYPVVFDPNASIAMDRYAVPGLPVTYVLNPQGRVVGNPVLGPVSDDGYSQEFTRELKEALKT